MAHLPISICFSRTGSNSLDVLRFYNKVKVKMSSLISRIPAASEKKALLFLFCVSLVLRIAFVLIFSSHASAGDSGRYIGTAQTLLRGEGFGARPHVPVYPLFVALVFSVSSGNVFAVQLTQAVVGAFTAVVTYFLAKHIFDPQAALLAAGLVALHPGLIFWTPYVLTETLFVFLIMLLMLSFYHLKASPSIGRSVCTGALLGITALCRPIAIGLLPLFVLWFLLTSKLPLKRRWALIGVFAVSSLLLIAPWIARNYLAFNAFILNPSGKPFYSGNNPHPLVASLGVADVGYDFPFPPEITGMNAAQADLYFRQAAIAYIWNNPGQFARNALQRLYLFWSPFFPTYSKRHNIANALLYLPFYAAAVSGLILSREKWHQTLLLALLFAWFSVAHMITIVDWDQRYRMPLQPFIAVLASYSLYHIGVRMFKTRLESKSGE